MNPSASRIARGDLAEEIAELKREPGKDMIAWGAAASAQSLTRLALVDEYRLVLQPVALGHGLPLTKDLTTPLRLELVDAQTYDTGAALHITPPAPQPPLTRSHAHGAARQESRPRAAPARSSGPTSEQVWTCTQSSPANEAEVDRAVSRVLKMAPRLRRPALAFGPISTAPMLPSARSLSTFHRVVSGDPS